MVDNISEIKNRLDIVDVVGGYVSLKKSGRNYKGICPFHAEKTPSFMVSQELQIFKCFGCGESGDIFAFIQKVEGLEFPQALKHLAEKAGVELITDPDFTKQASKNKILYEINHLTSEFYHYILTKHQSGKAGLDYLKNKRKLRDETIKKWKLGMAPASWDILYRSLTKKKYKIDDLLRAGVIVPKKSGNGFSDKFYNRVIFPLTGIDGKIVGFTGRVLDDREPKYLNTSETPIFHKSNFIYGLDKAKLTLKKEGAVFVEGNMDVISAHEAGITNVVASSGTSLTSTQLNIIGRYTKDLIFCFDSDNAGIAAVYRAVEMAERENFNIKVAVIPSGHKDLDELAKSDLSAAKSMLNSAVPVYDFFLATVLKKHNKKEGLGKKKIMEELTPAFSRISNKILMDHYVKKIAEELSLNEDVIQQFFTFSPSGARNSAVLPPAASTAILISNIPQRYMLALLLRTDLDTAELFMYKLKQKDFTDTTLAEIFSKFKEYLDSNKKRFDIQYFIDNLTSPFREICTEIYLWDLGDRLESEKELLAELATTLTRLKKETVKQELKELTEEIRLAELEKNQESIKKLTKKLNKVAKSLES